GAQRQGRRRRRRAPRSAAPGLVRPGRAVHDAASLTDDAHHPDDGVWLERAAGRGPRARGLRRHRQAVRHERAASAGGCRSERLHYNSLGMPHPTILVVDDEPLIRFALNDRLTADGYKVVEAGTAADALARSQDADLVLLDYKLPDGDGISVLTKIKEQHPETLVILLTAHQSVELAVEAMKQGAYHYANKPFNLDEISMLVAKALETTELRREVRTLRETQAQPYSFDRIVGEGPQVAAVKTLLKKVATSPASTVLLTGESGTGKDLAAKVLHYNSARSG